MFLLLSVFSAQPVLGEVSPSFLIQKEGDTIDMFCEAAATPEPTLVWYKDGKVRLHQSPHLCGIKMAR